MATITLVTRKVADFDQWKKDFDANESYRAERGMHVKKVYRSADNPNVVTVLTEVSSAEAAREFYQNPKFQKMLQVAEGEGFQTEVRILEEV